MKNTRDLYEASLVLFTPTRHTKDIEDAYEHEPYIRMFLDTVSENQFEETLYRILEMFHQNKHEIMKTITPLMKEHDYEYSVPIVHYVIDIDLPKSDNKAIVKEYTIRWMFLLEEFLRADAKLSESAIRKIANGDESITPSGLKQHNFYSSEERNPNSNLETDAAANTSSKEKTAVPKYVAPNKFDKNNVNKTGIVEYIASLKNIDGMPDDIKNFDIASYNANPKAIERKKLMYILKKNAEGIKDTLLKAAAAKEATSAFGRRGRTARTRTTGTRGKMYKLAWVPKHKIHSGMIVHPTMKKGTRMLTAVPL